MDMHLVRHGLCEREEMIGEARQTIEAMDEVIRKLSAPANRIGLFIGCPRPDTAQVLVGGADYYCACDPRVDLRSLRRGTRVLVNEAYAVVGEVGADGGGPVAKVQEVLGRDRLRVGAEHGAQSVVLQRGEGLSDQRVKQGDEVRVDAQYRMALELMGRPEGGGHYLEEVPELPWEKVGGQQNAIRAIRDAIELPLLHPGLFGRFEHQRPKGFLLHGPPGCGKTLIGKATAYNLAAQLGMRVGGEARGCFMHIKGPEVLNMWVGESERIVREIFSAAREKRREGWLPILFIDEAESILGTRRATRHSSILSTLVPMFCTEMDGIDSLGEVVVILASNRPDLIDPAILRPGRIDRKIKVERPGRDGAAEIFRIYLRASLPYEAGLLGEHGGAEGARDWLVERVVERCFERSERSRFVEVVMRSGKREVLSRGDLLSGALIASIVERAKGRAIRRALAGGGEGLEEEDLLEALDAEYAEGEVFPPAEMTEDWLQLIDQNPENVVRVVPVRHGGQRSGYGYGAVAARQTVGAVI